MKNRLNVEYIPVGQLKPYEKNARKHEEYDVGQIAESIERYGFNDPIGIWGKDNIIVEGHGRLLAAKKLGMDKVPCIRLDDLTDEQRREYAILHNKTAELSTWDFDLLAEDIGELDFSDFDIDWGLPADVEETEIVEDEPPEVDEESEPITKLGDIWQLGEHRLICGDSTDTATVERLMDGKKADMVFTDPPYGMKKEAEGVLNDNLNFDDLLEFNKKWIPLSFEATKENGSWYCWGIDEPLMDIYSEILKPMIKANKITFRNLITWKKENENPTMIFNGACSSNNRSYYTNEKCLFVMCGVQGFNNNADNYFEKYEPIRNWLENEAKKAEIDSKKIKEICGVGMYSHWFTKSQWDLMTEENYKKIQIYCAENNIDAFGVKYGEIKEEYQKIKEEYQKIKEEWYLTRAYFDGNADKCVDVWVYDVTSQKERELTGGHATPKPIALCSRAIKSSSREGEIVLDLFGGSGSTLIACEQLNRVCYMAELDPKYCDVIIKRWENFTGQKAVKIS